MKSLTNFKLTELLQILNKVTFEDMTKDKSAYLEMENEKYEIGIAYSKANIANSEMITAIPFENKLERQKVISDFITTSKYHYLCMKYILNHALRDADHFEMTIDDLCRFCQIDMSRPIKKTYIESINHLMSVYIMYSYSTSDGRKMTGYSPFITAFEKEKYRDFYIVKFGEWKQHVADSIQHKENMFIEGTVDYSEYMSKSDISPTTIGLPQKIINLYRANQNKNRDLEYRTCDYLSEILTSVKNPRSRVILQEIGKLNNSISSIGIELIFTGPYITPVKFINSKFKIIKKK